MLSQCLLKKILRRSSVGSLLRVRCWLGRFICSKTRSCLFFLLDKAFLNLELIYQKKLVVEVRVCKNFAQTPRCLAGNLLTFPANLEQISLLFFMRKKSWCCKRKKTVSTLTHDGSPTPLTYKRCPLFSSTSKTDLSKRNSSLPSSKLFLSLFLKGVLASKIFLFCLEEKGRRWG